MTSSRALPEVPSRMEDLRSGGLLSDYSSSSQISPISFSDKRVKISTVFRALIMNSTKYFYGMHRPRH